jgi:oxygen-independent coproporphyrinogen III oxidase
MDLGGVYLHIPFCKKKCSYCDFISYEKNANASYMSLLLKEYLMNQKEIKNIIFDTLFIGGGTPSLFSPQSFKPTIDHFFSHLPTDMVPEITIESNPESLTLKKLQQYLHLGINRISIGVQSFDPEVLKSAGRLHNPKEAILAVQNAFRAGFRNINIDLISGLPGETKKSWIINQSVIDTLPLTHLSCYLLDLSSKTPMYSLIEKGTLTLPDEALSLGLYSQFLQYLHHSGWKHYEISNLCKPGYECKHNMHYWKGDPYLGLGVSAVTYLPPWRRKNTLQPGRYRKSITSGFSASIYKEKITQKKLSHEKIMLGLRLLEEGILWSDIDSDKLDKVSDWLEKEYLKKKDTRLLLTQKGTLYANQIIASLF